MDIVLGVSMAPTSVRMLLVEGENADGLTIEDNQFDIADDDEAATLSASDQVISAILGTREGATEAGHELTSTGVTWTDPVDAAGLHEALATRKIENVMLVSAFMAAAALAQTVGNTVGYHHTALLFLERDTATLAVVDSADGAISDVHKELIPGDSVAELAGMLAGLDELETQPQSVFIVGTGVDVAAIKPQLETLTALPVSAAEEPETALAWGAALASANAPLFASSTAALAYAQDPGTGAVDPFAVSPGYLAAPDVPFGTELGEEDLAYSAVPDEEAEVHTVAQDVVSEEHLDHEPERRPLVLVGSILAVVFVAAALSLEVALALGIRPSVALLPRPLQNLIIQAPAPAAAPANVQVPEANHLIAPAIAPAPVNAPIPAARPAAPALVPAAPPIPVPAAPPVHIAAPAPVVVPLPLPVPVRAPEPVHVAPLPVPVHVPSPPVPVQFPQPVHLPSPQPPIEGAPNPPGHMPAPGEGPHGGNPGFGGGPGGFGGPPGGLGGGNPGFGGGPGGFGGPPGGFGGGNPGSGGPGGIPGVGGGGPGGFGGPPGGFGGGNPGSGGPGGIPGIGGGPGGFGGPPGGFGGGNPGFDGGSPGFGGGHGGFGGGPGGFDGGFGGGGHGFGGGGFGGGGFGGGGFGGGGHSFGGGGHGGGHH
ncbi:MAG TPA: hypothetical protein VII18_16370 [Mycobacterium sp.]